MACLLFAGKVKDEDIIYRNIDDNVGLHKCPEGFVPIFSDEAIANLNDTFKEKALAVCGDDTSCLFDIAATNDIAIGQSTLSEVTTINNEVEEVGT